MYGLVLLATMTPGNDARPPLAIAPPVVIDDRKDKKNKTDDWDRPPGFKSTAPLEHHKPDHVVPVVPGVSPYYPPSGYSAPTYSYGCSGSTAMMSYGCSGASMSYSSGYGYSMQSNSRRGGPIRRLFGRLRGGGCN